MNWNINQPRREGSAKIWWRMDGTTRLLIVFAAGALVAYFGSHIMGGGYQDGRSDDINLRNRLRQQMHDCMQRGACDYTRQPMRRNGNHAGFNTSFDPFGPGWRPLGMRLDPTESDPIEDRRSEHRNGDLSRLGPPPRWGEPQGSEKERSGDQGPTTSGAAPYRDKNGRPYRRWRDCKVFRSGGLDCGAWQTGPAPGEE
jgi:hypothetical protein